MTNLVETPALDVALAHIDMTRWGSKANVIALVRATIDYDGIARLSAREVAEIFGWEQKRGAESLLKELVADRVLILVERGAGSVGHGYRINPEVAQWRAVPWKPKLRERHGDGFLEVIIHRVLEATLPRPPSGHRRRLVPRRVTGAQAGFVPRPVTGAQIPAAPRSRPGHKPEGRAPATDRGTNPPLPPPHMPYCPPYGSRERKALQEIVEAIDRKGGYLRGRALEQLGELLDEGLDAEAAVVVITGRSWGKEGVGLRIVDYLRVMGVDLPAEARRLLAAEQERAAARAKLEREREEEEAALRELREQPDVKNDRMSVLWSAMGRLPSGQNGNGHNGKEPTGA